MKKILKKLHLYLALIFFLPLIIQGLSGSILVFRSEISDFILRQNYQFSKGEIRPVSEIISTAQNFTKQNFPDEENSINVLKIPYKNSQAAIVRLVNKDKKLNRDIFIDPVSLKIIKIRKVTENFFYLVKKFHTNLLIENSQIATFIGCYGFILLFLAISGIVLWWPKLKNFTRSIKFNFQVNGVAFHRVLHKTLGFWSFIILIIISLTGIYLAFPKNTSSIINTVFNNHIPNQDINIEPQKISKKFAREFNIENAINISKAEIKKSSQNIRLLSINFPQKPDQPFRFNFIKENYYRGEPPIIVFFDQSQQKIINIKNPADYSWAEKIISWQHALHAGEGLGIIWQVIIFLTGFLPIIFTITGIKMWISKKKKPINTKNEFFIGKS